MVEARVHGLTKDPKTQKQIVWLQSLQDNIVLPITIGGTEAASIYSGLREEEPTRPLTHDLIRSALDRFDAEVKELQIVDLKDGTFYANLVLSADGGETSLDTRPCDGIALALKYGAPIYLAEDVISQAGYAVRKTGPGGVLYVEPLEQSDGPSSAAEAVDEAPSQEADDGAEAVAETESGDSRLEDLKKQLGEAVEGERYEEAADIYRAIERLQKGGRRA